MDDNRILESIGGLKADIQNISKEVGLIRVKQDEQSERFNDLSTSLRLMKMGCESRTSNCQKEFAQINSKLSNDYININRLVKQQDQLETIASYKGKMGSKFKVFLATIATVLSIIIGANQIVSIKSKVSLNPVNTVYALPCDTIRSDSLDPFRIK